MGKTNKPVEIYAREINNEHTLAFFLKGQMYGCHYEKRSRLANALYLRRISDSELLANTQGARMASATSRVSNAWKWWMRGKTCWRWLKQLGESTG